MAVVHRYVTDLAWSGTTAVGYDHYNRRHAIGPLQISSDPAFRGDASLLNPEQLLVMAASSCQLLSFLAVAARARLDVVAYTDRAEGEMPESSKPISISRIVLKPRIAIRGPIEESRVRHFIEVAHRECYIANSLKTEIEIQPAIEIL